MSVNSIHFRLDLRFLDGTECDAESDLIIAAGNGLTDCNLVISTLPDFLPEQRERMVESIQLALTNWFEQHGVAPIADPSPAM